MRYAFTFLFAFCANVLLVKNVRLNSITKTQQPPVGLLIMISCAFLAGFPFSFVCCLLELSSVLRLIEGVLHLSLFNLCRCVTSFFFGKIPFQVMFVLIYFITINAQVRQSSFQVSFQLFFINSGLRCSNARKITGKNSARLKRNTGSGCVSALKYSA